MKGPGAEAWLDRMLACRIPDAGRMVLAPMLKQDGKLIGDFTLAKLGDGDFFVAGSGIAEDYHMRWFLQHLPGDGSVRVEALGAGMCGLSIAGPKAREVLEKVTDADVSAETFKFMDIARMDIGMAPALVGRVSFTGDLGYEIWMRARIPAQHLPRAVAGRRRSRHPQFRPARVERAAAGEELWRLGRASTGRSTRPTRPGLAVSWR